MPQTSVKTAPAFGRAGEPADEWTARNGAISSGTSEETSAEIPVGIMVQASTVNSDGGVKLLTGTTNKLAGIVGRAHSMSDSELGAVGYKPGATFPIETKGRWFVVIEEDVTRDSPVRVRCAGIGTIGAFRATADGTNTLDLSAFARFVRSALAVDGVGELDIDITNAALAVAG